MRVYTVNAYKNMEDAGNTYASQIWWTGFTSLHSLILQFTLLQYQVTNTSVFVLDSMQFRSNVNKSMAYTVNTFLYMW